MCEKAVCDKAQWCLEYVPDHLQDGRKCVEMSCHNRHRYIIRYIPMRFMTREIYRNYIKLNSYMWLKHT